MNDLTGFAAQLEIPFHLAQMFLVLLAFGGYLIPRLGRAARVATCLALAAVAVSVAMRGIAAGHLPMANMYEYGLLFGVALTALILAADLRLGSSAAAAVAAAAFVLTSVQLLFYQEARPLMPALKSLWLTAHVLTAVVAYALLAAAAAIGLAGLFRRGPAAADQHATSLISIAFPFLTLLMITGAVWAEYAWGAFWRWDPKETWALITWLYYLVALHLARSRGWMGRRALWLSVAGFAIVCFTWFGVNLLLSGLHSYT